MVLVKLPVPVPASSSSSSTTTAVAAHLNPSPAPAPAPAPAARLYFAYGSNLSSTQMRARCPGSPAAGLARLDGWRWIIHGRGYANVVEQEDRNRRRRGGDHQGDESSGSGGGDVVFGVLYALSAADEAALDRYEGVPEAYTKELVRMEKVTRSAGRGGGGDGNGDGDGEVPDGEVEALVYVDRERVEPGKPRDEYVGRMNRGVKEATEEWGLPGWWVKDVIRPFIPEK